MLRNYDKRHFGYVDFTTNAKAIDAVNKFLDKALCHFPDFLKLQALERINENVITSKLEIYLQRQARITNEIFMFQFQCPEINSTRSTDISAIFGSSFYSSEAFFVIEAKRLPTRGSGREREYVQGNLGAMERFKRGHHGKNLQKSAILGYIEDKDFTYWYSKICLWINDLIAGNTDSSIIWIKDDLLTFLKDSDGVSSYVSINGRLGGSPIKLTHYWISIN